MGVTFIAPQGTYTAPAKLVSKSITENGTYDPADDNANGYSSVTVNVEGGGGSSDFSTAEVTLVNNKTPKPMFYMPIALEVQGQGQTMKTCVYGVQNSGTYNAVLYGGQSTAKFDSNYMVNRSVSVSGDVQDLGNFEYLITGDCTITVS